MNSSEDKIIRDEINSN